MIYLVYYWDENDSIRYQESFYLSWEAAQRDYKERISKEHIYDGVEFKQRPISG